MGSPGQVGTCWVVTKARRRKKDGAEVTCELFLPRGSSLETHLTWTNSMGEEAHVKVMRKEK